MNKRVSMDQTAFTGNAKGHGIKIVHHRSAQVNADLTEVSDRRLDKTTLEVFSSQYNLSFEMEIDATQAIELGTALLAAGEQIQMENAQAKEQQDIISSAGVLTLGDQILGRRD